MEKKLNKMVQDYQVEFKNSIKKWLEDKSANITNNSEEVFTSDFLKHIFDYNAFEFTKEDFQKRKRAKNTIPQSEKCIAQRSNGYQCTRRRKNGNELLCGTHLKGTPHGVFAANGITPAEAAAANGSSSSAAAIAAYSAASAQASTKIEIWIQEIKGINYYIDNVNNVYRTEDIIANKINPDIIAKWKLNGNDKYTIPEFGI
jgi:hypothetical protein